MAAMDRHSGATMNPTKDICSLANSTVSVGGCRMKGATGYPAFSSRRPCSCISSTTRKAQS